MIPEPDGDATSAVTGTSRVGSASSVTADLDDVRALGALLSTISGDLLDAAGRAASIEWQLPTAGDVLSPGTAMACTTSSASLAASCTTASLTAGTLSALALATATAYELAEAQATDVFHTLIAVQALALPLARIATCDMDGRATPPDETATIAASAIALLDAVLPGNYEVDMRGFSTLMHQTFGPTKSVTTSLVASPGAAGAPKPARSVSDAMARVGDMYENDDRAAHIDVQRVVDPATGQGHWTVILPGTSKWGYGAPNPLDLDGNVMAAGGMETPMEKSVAAALRDAMAREGVSGRGEPVMVVGHSQGGMVMTNLARHHGSDLNITRIVTFGSPVGASAIPKNVRALNIENRQDIVPGLDGLLTGTRDPRRTRVVIDDPNSQYGPDGSHNVINAHDDAQYQRDYAHVLQDSHKNCAADPLVQFEAGSSGFFQGTAHTYQYDATRTPTAAQKAGSIAASTPPSGHGTAMQDSRARRYQVTAP